MVSNEKKELKLNINKNHKENIMIFSQHLSQDKSKGKKENQVDLGLIIVKKKYIIKDEVNGTKQNNDMESDRHSSKTLNQTVTFGNKGGCKDRL
jgi:hypothetical protein